MSFENNNPEENGKASARLWPPEIPPDGLVMISVYAACEELACSQDPREALSWLQLLHHSLLRDRLDAYDPSEVFLCLQRAALRFNTHEVWSESVWAVAALARVCVGPSWRLQLCQRRSQLFGCLDWQQQHQPTSSTQQQDLDTSRSEDATPRFVVTQGSSPRSYSPMTSSSFGNMSTSRCEIWYPPIPEVLPAAMLRFAASAIDGMHNEDTTQRMKGANLDGQKHLASAQRELVLALCCTLFDEPSDLYHSNTRGDWSIVGAMSPVMTMVRVWLLLATTGLSTESEITEKAFAGVAFTVDSPEFESDASESTTGTTAGNDHILDHQRLEDNDKEKSASVGEKDVPSTDWWFSLDVTRAITDLASNGWSLPSRNKTGAEIVILLLTIAEKGMALQNIRHDEDVADQDAREEQLAAVSSTAEAVSALASLGSTGCIPRSTLSLIVRVLCRLLSEGKDTSRLASTQDTVGSPSQTEEDIECELEKETFETQQQSCYDDIDDLFHSLAGYHSSATVTVMTLMKIMEENILILQDGNSSTTLMTWGTGLGDAPVAIRVLADLFWGQNSVGGMSHLRIFWSPYLNILCKAVPSMNVLFSEKSKGGHEDGSDTPKQSYRTRTSFIFLVAAEIVSTVRRLADSELIGEALLTPIEWDIFLLLLGDCCLPWLSLSKDCECWLTKDANVVKGLKSDVVSIVVKIGDSLGNCISLLRAPLLMTGGRHQLHELILAKACPYLEPDQSKKLATCSIQSWARHGFQPYLYAEWRRVASHMLAQAFARYKDCSYVHSAPVRLQALFLVTQDNGDDPILPEGEDETKVENTPVADTDAYLCPLTLTMHTRELHLDLINEVILPYVLLVVRLEITNFHDSESTCPVRISVPNRSKLQQHTQNRSEHLTMTRKERAELLELETYAVQLIGRLFVSEACERELRFSFVAMFRTLALRMSARENSSLDDFYVCIEAIHQIEICLFASFRSLSIGHLYVIPLVKALCEIIDSYRTEIFSTSVSNDDLGIARRAVVLFALVPVSRLSMSRDQRLVFSHRERLSIRARSLSIELEDFGLRRQLFRSAENDGCSHFEEATWSPIIVRAGKATDYPATGVDSNIISFDALAPVICCLINSSALPQERTKDNLIERRSNDLTGRLRLACFDTITSWLMSGIRLSRSDELSRALVTPSPAGRSFANDDLRVRSHFVAAYAEHIFSHHVGLPLEGNTSFKLLLDMSTSNKVIEAEIGCRSLCVVLTCPAITRCKSFRFEEVLSSVAKRLCDYAQKSELTVSETDGSLPNVHDKSRLCSSLLSVLFDILSREGLLTCLGPEIRIIVFRACLSLCYSVPKLNRFAIMLSLRCAALILATSKLDEVVWYSSDKEIKRTLHWPSSKGAKHTQASTSISLIIRDLLTKRYQFLVDEDGGSLSTTHGLGQQMSCHLSSAEELYAINAFLVESSEKCSEEPSASWRCGNNILSIRLGASNSRYRGWIDIILRSPTKRQRLMVRLSGMLSLEAPDLTSSLWCTEDHAKPANGHSYEIHTAELVNDRHSDVVDKAHSMIERCDISLAGLIDEIEDAVESCLPSAAVSSSQMSSEASDHSAAEEHVTLVVDQSEFMGARLFLEPIADEIPQHNDAGTNSSVLSIHRWLSNLLQHRNHVIEVEEQLQILGFSEDQLLTIEPPTEQDTEADYVASHFWPVRRLEAGHNLDRALSILDRTSTMLTQKVALLCTGEEEADSNDMNEHEHERSLEDQVLRATTVSADFLQFVSSLSNTVLTRHMNYFSGGLDTSEISADGRFAALWMGSSDLAGGLTSSVMVFHVVSLMPTGVNNRKRHVGNDNVQIVFVDGPNSLTHDFLLENGHVDTPDEMDAAVVSGDFGFVVIFVELLGKGDLVRVSVRTRKGLSDSTKEAMKSLTGISVLPRKSYPGYVKQLAARADLACRATMEDRLGLASNWEERLNQIQETGRRLERKA